MSTTQECRSHPSLCSPGTQHRMFSRYSASPGPSPCLPCPAGTFAAAPGAANCSKCPFSYTSVYDQVRMASVRALDGWNRWVISNQFSKCFLTIRKAQVARVTLATRHSTGSTTLIAFQTGYDTCHKHICTIISEYCFVHLSLSELTGVLAVPTGNAIPVLQVNIRSGSTVPA